MTQSQTPSELRRWAIAYAIFGWPVHPLVARAKRPLTKNGCLDATTDAHQVAAWWDRWPNANIGLRTGEEFDVLDIDGETGRASLLALTGPGYVHPGPVSRSAHGEHWLFIPKNTMNRQNVKPPFEKLDWRGKNGYIAAPPSIHPDGPTYTWINQPRTTLPDYPEWLIPFVMPYKQPVPRDEHGIVILKTNQHDPLNPTKARPVSPKRFANMKMDILGIANELGMETRTSNNRAVTQCIFHTGDNEASLVLYLENNSFFCFGCGAWGDAIDLSKRQIGGRRG